VSFFDAMDFPPDKVIMDLDTGDHRGIAMERSTMLFIGLPSTLWLLFNIAMV
jgi:hypothetical protein